MPPPFCSTSLFRKAKAALLAFALCSVLSQAHAQTALGSIEGVVVDSDNAPVAGASVYPVSGPAGTGRAHGAVTNADGRFRIEQLVPGTYRLSAFKTEDGYADQAEAFFSQPDHPLTSVTVTSATQAADISIALGAKCGILHIEAEDSATHRPITQAVLTLRQRNGGQAMQAEKTLPGDFLVLPADVTVDLHVAGYSAWKFTDEGRDFVTLRPGEHRSIRAQMLAEPRK